MALSDKNHQQRIFYVLYNYLISSAKRQKASKTLAL